MTGPRLKRDGPPASTVTLTYHWWVWEPAHLDDGFAYKGYSIRTPTKVVGQWVMHSRMVTTTAPSGREVVMHYSPDKLLHSLTREARIDLERM